MTGGIVLVLGEVGLNFAAGMSGGIAYVYDAEHTLAGRCNREMVDLEAPARDELARIRALIDEHTRRTGSALGAKLLYQFDDIVSCFVKVVPREYAQMIALTEQLESQGLSHDAAVERAFEMRNGAPTTAPREPAAAAQR